LRKGLNSFLLSIPTVREPLLEKWLLRMNRGALDRRRTEPKLVSDIHLQFLDFKRGRSKHELGALLIFRLNGKRLILLH